jgi:hypothetical protein
VGPSAGTASIRAQLEPLDDSGSIPSFVSSWTSGTEFLTKAGCVDTTAPALHITSPTNGANFTHFRITISGTATDSGTGNGGIDSVRVNGQRAENDTADGNGTAQWSRTLNLNPGSNTITVVARDGSSNTNEATQSITVNYQPPSTSSDFSGDGKADIVLRNYSTGANEIWAMNGSTREQIVALPSATNLNWALEGAADFNQDGKLDLVWRNYGNGTNAIWLMDGTERIGVLNLPAAANLNWHLVGAGDFNSDTQPDLVWRNWSTGENAIWLMQGASRIGVVSLPAASNLDWKLEAVGDLNGDGQLDLIWRNYASGNNSAWLMEGTSRIGVVSLRSAANLAWALEGAADLDNDGHLDLLWRNTSNGSNAVWLMEGTTFLTSQPFDSQADLNWRICF